MTTNLFHIYDKMCKRILTLSSKSVINLINGLFETDYPPDSTITYNWTEFEDQNLKRTLADTIITINGRFSYHMEIQMTIDEEIIFRVFEYGFGHAYKNRICEKGRETLSFPEPKIIYLSENDIEKAPDVYSVLIPFFLLKLRSSLTQSRSETNKKALKNLIENDIVNSIKTNLELGNISSEDGRKLYDMIQQLYWHIYADYEELEDITMMIDESLDLPSDIYDAKIEKLEIALDEKNATIDSLTTEIDSLKKQLEELKKNTPNG